MTRFRMAVPADAAGILQIYAPYILNTRITLETEVPELEAFTRRVREISARYPYLVCEKDGKIIGYSYACGHRERQAYRWNAEVSAYLAREHTGQGLGKAMLLMLMELLRLQNFRNVYSCVTLPNPASERVNLLMGFTPAGIWRNTGCKLGKWVDAAWFEKRIGPAEADPAEPLPITAVPAEAVDRILREGGKAFVR